MADPYRYGGHYEGGSFVPNKPPKAKPRPKPKPKPNLAAAVRQVGRQGERTARAIRPTGAAPTPRSLFGSSGSGGRKPASADPLAAKAAAILGSGPAKAKPTGVPLSASGLDRLQLLHGGSGQSLLGHIIRAGAREGLGIVTGAPAQMQWGIGASLYPFMKGAEALGYTPGPVDKTITKQTETGAKAVAADYAYRYGPLFHGDWRTAGSRAADAPLSTALDLATAYSLVGKAPELGAKLAMKVAPESGLGQRAATSLSSASLPERLGLNAENNAIRARQGRVPLPAPTKPGARYQPPRRVVGRTSIGEEGRAPIGERVVEVPRKAASPNVMSRTVQRTGVRIRENLGPKIEAKAEAHIRPPGAQLTRGEKWRQGVARRLTAQAKYDRYQKGNTRGFADLVAGREEAAVKSGGVDLYQRAVNKLKKDKNAAGIDIPRIGVEEAAARLHLDDTLSARGGKTPSQLRDLWVRSTEGRQKAARARGTVTNNARVQVEVVKSIPDKLLELTDMSDPAVARVARVVTEGRRIDEISQARSVEAGVITEATAAEAKTRGSALTIGGSKWAGDEIQRITRQASIKRRGIRKAIARARAAGDSAEAGRLNRELVARRAATRQKIAEIRQQSITETPELVKARENLAAAEEKLALSGVGRNGRGGAVVSASPRSVARREVPVHEGSVDLPRLVDDLANDKVARRDGLMSEGDRSWAREEIRKYGAEGAAKKNGIRLPRSQSGTRVVEDAVTTPAPARTLTPARTASETRTTAEISAATRARDTYFKQVKRMERENLGFTPPRRPELVGDRGVYIPDRAVDPRPGHPQGTATGFGGPARAKRSEGRLRSSARMDMNPELLAHQAKRAARNWTGTISGPALNELMGMAEYHVPGTKTALTGSKARQIATTDPNRVALIHVGNFRKAIKKLDDVPEGEMLPQEAMSDVFFGRGHSAIPEGALSSDYVAISKAAADVWRETMTRIPYADRALELWKGGLLTLSPRWYVNNTVGLAGQYILMGGPNVRTIWRASSDQALRKAMVARSPNAVGDTMIADIGSHGNLPKVMGGGFRAEDRLERLWRRAAYLDRAKHNLQREGFNWRKMTPAEQARAVENMPHSLAREVVREVDLYMGNFRKFNAFEKNVAKRVIPFYSWLRVISRLVFTLPYRSPLRVQAMNVLQKAQAAGLNPNDRLLPYYSRGSIRLPGDKVIPTWSSNPAQTVAPLIAALGAKDPLTATLREAVGWIHPGLQLAYSQASGTNAFGQGITTPPGTASYGQNPQSFNEVTGSTESAPAAIPWTEALLQAAIPGQVGTLRKVIAGNRTPIGTATTADLLNNALGHGKPDWMLYQPARRGPIGRKPTAASPYTAWFGAPLYQENPAAVQSEARTRALTAEKTRRELERSKRRAAARYRP